MMSAVGRNIRKLREERGMSQAELAKIAGVTDKAVSTWEIGLKIPRLSTLAKVAEYFNVTVSELYEDIDIVYRNPNPLKKEERELLIAYRAAPEEVREAVMMILSQYKKEGTP